ncbi:MAG: DUF1460 domain-containing protein [Dysgonamonadaceae bacterium]|jgi:hypothetical protein|nr:DUF1460 domain-containing protein [Dysgonamonadaceae bacterium]
MKLLLSVTFACLSAVAPTGDADEGIVESRFQLLAGEKDHSPGNILATVALSFVDTPYEPNTLEGKEEESLIVHLQSFDCTTFVETCLAMTLAFQSSPADFNGYCRYLQKIRYRKGIINGYASRLHYASDWIYENDAAGLIRNLTRAIGGKVMPLHVDFMSTHAAAYQHLEKHREDIAAIRECESVINARSHYCIPVRDISRCGRRIRTGDIVFFASSIPGLDISHVGIVYRCGGRLTFVHASSKFRKVVVQPGTLSGYCENSETCTGIVVCRMGGGERKRRIAGKTATIQTQT